MPGMGDHTIIGMPDDRLGERICAFAVPLRGYENLKFGGCTGLFAFEENSKAFFFGQSG